MNVQNKRSVFGHLGKTYRFLKHTQVSTWVGTILIVLTIVIVAVMVKTAKIEFRSPSEAATGPSFSFSPSSSSVTVGQTFNVDVNLNTQNVNIVAARAMINFNPANFQLVSWDTTNSTFSANNTCQYNGKACEIIDDNRANGNFSITLAKPSPGVNSSNGKMASLTFKALNPVSQSTSDIKLSFVAPGDATDSDMIMDDGKGTDVLVGVVPITITASNPTSTCTSFTYSEWATCQSDGTQTRTVISSLPAGCTGGNPILSQSCTPPPVTCSAFTYSDWGTCQSDGTQARTVVSSSPAGCIGGSPTLTQSCTLPPTTVTCTNFGYNKWGACLNGVQTRTVKWSLPTGCTDGTPVLTQTCTVRGGGRNK